MSIDYVRFLGVELPVVPGILPSLVDSIPPTETLGWTAYQEKECHARIVEKYGVDLQITPGGLAVPPCMGV